MQYALSSATEDFFEPSESNFIYNDWVYVRSWINYLFLLYSADSLRFEYKKDLGLR